MNQAFEQVINLDSIYSRIDQLREIIANLSNEVTDLISKGFVAEQDLVRLYLMAGKKALTFEWDNKARVHFLCISVWDTQSNRIKTEKMAIDPSQYPMIGPFITTAPYETQIEAVIKSGIFPEKEFVWKDTARLYRKGAKVIS